MGAGIAVVVISVPLRSPAIILDSTASALSAEALDLGCCFALTPFQIAFLGCGWDLQGMHSSSPIFFLISQGYEMMGFLGGVAVVVEPMTPITLPLLGFVWM